MSDSRVRFNDAQIRAVVRSATKRALEITATMIRDDAKRSSPVDTGHLRASIDYTPIETTGDKMSTQIGTNVEYAAAVEFGTSSSHTIVPVNARVLSWIDKLTGKRIFAKRVTIPPRPPKPYLIPAFNRHRDKLNLIIAQEVRRGLSSID